MDWHYMDRFQIDSHKLIYHPQRVADLANAGRDWAKHKNIKPIYAEISSSGACNHRCTFCSVDYIGYKPRFLSRLILKSFFKSAQTIGLKSVMFAGDGEPLLNREIVEIINDAQNFNIDTSFTTNGVYMTSSFSEKALHNISWIKISMNAGTPETYEKIHRTNKDDFEKVWSNLDFAIKLKYSNTQNKISTAIGIQSLILPDNITSLSALASRASDTGLDYLVLKPYVHNIYMNQAGYSDIDYAKKEYKNAIETLKKDFDTDNFKVISRTNALNKLTGSVERYSTCWSTPALWFYISGDGSVYSCGAHVGSPNFYLGNINGANIADIWQSDQRKNCLDYVQDELNLESCRRTCRMDEVNKYLSEVIECRPPHVNFI